MASVTTNKNFLSPVGFQFKVDSTKYPNLEYFCTSANLPGITLSESPVPYRGAAVGLSGDRVTFEDLTVTFNVTENMENYIETFDWMHSLLEGTSEDVSDATLLILTSHNNVSKEIKFADVFPTGLSSLEFNVNNSDIEYLTAQVTFKYSYFEFK